MTTEKKITPPILPISKTEAHRAFERLHSRMKAIRRREVTAVDVDIEQAAILVLTAESRIRALQPEIVRLPPFNPELLTSLREVALAAWYAHVVVAPGADQEKRLNMLIKETADLKRSLLLQADALASVGLLDAKRIAQLRAGRSHWDLAGDTLALSDLFRRRWKQLRRKTTVTEEKLDRAANLATELLQAIGDRARAFAAAEHLRAQAYSLLYQAYDKVRRAVVYLRWEHGDADDLAPSIGAEKRARRTIAARAKGRLGPAAGDVESAAPGTTVH